MKQEIEWLDNTPENLKKVSIYDLLIIKGRHVQSRMLVNIFLLGKKTTSDTLEHADLFMDIPRNEVKISDSIIVDAFAVLEKDEIGAH